MTQDTLRVLKLTVRLTLCSNSLELLVVVFSSSKMLWRKVTMVLRPFTMLQWNTVEMPHLVSCECLLSKATGSSDSQNAILETTENTSTREIEVRK